MPFDVQGARDAGYSDAEIAEHLARKSARFDLEGAKRAGYSDAEIIDHLVSREGRTLPPQAGDVPVYSDVAKSIALSGAPKGALGSISLPAELGNLAAKGMAFGVKKAMDLTPDQQARLDAVRPFYGYQEAKDAVEEVTGEFYKPKTTPGRYASTAAEFAVGSPVKYIGPAIAGGFASEAAGDATGNNPYMKMLAGILTTGGLSFLQNFRGSAGRATADALRPVTKEQIDLADALVKRSFNSGAPITGAEAIANITQNPNSKLLALQRVTEDSTKGGPVMQQFMASRPVSNEALTRRAIRGVSPVTAFATIPERVGKAAGDVVSAATRERSAMTGKLYKHAEEALLDVAALKPVMEKIDAEIIRLGEGSDAAAVLRGLKSKIESAAPSMEPIPTGVLDESGTMISRPKFVNAQQGPMIQIYKETRDQLAKTAEQEGALASTVKGVVKPINKELGVALEAQNPALQRANAAHRLITRDVVRPLELSPVGKIAAVNPETEGALTRQFRALTGSDNATPKEIGVAVRLLSLKDPQAARDLVAAGLANEMKAQAGTLASGSPMYGQQMAGAKWAAALDTPEIREAIEALPNGKDAYAGLRNAFDILEAQGMRRPAYNSLDAKQALKGGNISNAFKNIPGLIGVAYENFRYARDTKMLAELLTSPNSVAGLVKLGKLDPKSASARLLLGMLLVGNKAASSE